MSAAVESYNPRGSASFIEQRQAAKECKSQSVIMSSMRLLVKTFSRIQTELCYECQSRLKTPSQLVGVSCHAKAKGTVRRRGGGVNSLISMKSFVRTGTTQVIVLQVRQVPDSVRSSGISLVTFNMGRNALIA